jgi:hypothetical protein
VAEPPLFLILILIFLSFIHFNFLINFQKIFIFYFFNFFLYCVTCQLSGVDTGQTVKYWIKKNRRSYKVRLFPKLKYHLAVMRIETEILKNKVFNQQVSNMYLIIFIKCFLFYFFSNVL